MPTARRKLSNHPLPAKVTDSRTLMLSAHTLESKEPKKFPAKTPIVALASPAFMLPGVPVTPATVVRSPPPKPKRKAKRIEAANVTPACLKDKV